MTAVSKTTPHSEKLVQPLTIHFLSVKKICSFFSLVADKVNLGDLVERIQKYYCAKARQKYELLVPEQQMGDYRFVAYGQVVKVTTVLSRWISTLGCEEDLESRKVSYLFFYYRTFEVGKKKRREIFALTSGQAYAVVAKFCDYRFPIQIARRLLHPKISSSKKRPLVGGVLIRSEVLKQATSVSNAEAVQELFTRIRYNFREDSSIFQLPCFQNSKGKPLRRGMDAEIGLGSVRLGKRCQAEHYPSILSHFSSVAWGDATQLTPAGKKPEADSDEFDYLDYLHPVDFDRAARFDKRLVKRIHAAVVEGEDFPAFDFCHSHRSDYFRGENYQLCYETQRVNCDRPFAAGPMVTLLKKFKALTELKDRKKFAEALAKVFVSFTSFGTVKKAPFIDFIEGEMRVVEGEKIETVWRLHKMWFEVRADYLALIHQEFAASLDKLLIAPKKKGFLPLPWLSPAEKEARKKEVRAAHLKVCDQVKAKKACTHKTKYDAEAEYNQKYVSRDGFYFGDKIFAQQVELFDILWHVGKQLFLYAVKEGFNQKTRDACSQVLTAAKLLQTLRQRGTSNVLDEYYQSIVDYKGNDPHRIATKAKYEKLGKKGFLGLFAKCKLVFVYAFIDDAKKSRQLSDEKRIQMRVTSATIEKVNRAFNKKGKEIFDELVKAQYLTPKGFPTSRFFSTSADKFALKGISVANQLKTLHAHIREHASQFDSTIAKLEILRLKRDIEELGFEFRICQIPRTDDEAASVSSSDSDNDADVGGLDDLSDLDDEERGRFRNDIGEGDSFDLDGATYQICPTEADLACGLHALFGEKTYDGRYIYMPKRDFPAWKAARIRYVTVFNMRYEALRRERITPCLVKLVKDYLKPRSSPYVKMVFDRVPVLMAALKGELAQIATEERAQKEARRKLYTELVEDEKMGEHLSQTVSFAPSQSPEQSLTQFRVDPQFRERSLNTQIARVLRGIETTPIGSQLSQNIARLDQLERRREALYVAFVENPEVIRAYLTACHKREYEFSNTELLMAGWLFNKRVTVFEHQGKDAVAPEVEGPVGSEARFIFHKENHFSHCEVVPAAAAATASAAAPSQSGGGAGLIAALSAPLASASQPAGGPAAHLIAALSAPL